MNILENASIVTWPFYAQRTIDTKRQTKIFEEQIDKLAIRLQRLNDNINTLLVEISRRWS